MGKFQPENARLKTEGEATLQLGLKDEKIRSHILFVGFPRGGCFLTLERLAVLFPSGLQLLPPTLKRAVCFIHFAIQMPMPSRNVLIDPLRITFN